MCVCVCESNISTDICYLHQHVALNLQLYLVSTLSPPSASHKFRSCFVPHTQLSSGVTFCLMRSISLSRLQQCFKNAALLCFVCHDTLELCITEINTIRISKYPHSCHVACQHAMLTHKSVSAVRQKQSAIYFIQISLIVQTIK